MSVVRKTLLLTAALTFATGILVSLVYSPLVVIGFFTILGLVAWPWAMLTQNPTTLAAIDGLHAGVGLLLTVGLLSEFLR